MSYRTDLLRIGIGFNRGLIGASTPGLLWPESSEWPDIAQDTFFGADSASISGAGAIASAAAFGTPSLQTVAAPASISSAEAEGAPSLKATVSSTAADSGEAFGRPRVGDAQEETQPSGGGVWDIIREYQPVPLPAYPITLFLHAVRPAEAFGEPMIGTAIKARGISTKEQSGEPLMKWIGPCKDERDLQELLLVA